MYSHCYKDMFSIYIVLELCCKGKENIYELRDKVFSIHKYETVELYKTAFNIIKMEGLINVESVNGNYIAKSNSSKFLYFITKYKNNKTEFGEICNKIFELYKRKEVKDIKVSDLLEIFSTKPNARTFCLNLTCRKYFIPKMSTKYCDDCYLKMSHEDCPRCVELGKENPNRILRRFKMCNDCKNEKSEELNKIIDSHKEKNYTNCAFCNNPFEITFTNRKYCLHCKKISSHMFKCQSCGIIARKNMKSLKDKLCSFCRIEQNKDENIVSVDATRKIIVKKCSRCLSHFEVLLNPGWKHKNKCNNCKHVKNKVRKICPNCNKNNLKRNQTKCNICKKELIKQKQNKFIVKCKNKDCNNTFKKIGFTLYCEECRSNRKKIKQEEVKYIKSEKHTNEISIIFRFEDRFYNMLNNIFNLKKMKGNI